MKGRKAEEEEAKSGVDDGGVNGGVEKVKADKGGGSA